jgi:tripartite-type tricarboxylate transporter receptor subunit TctC
MANQIDLYTDQLTTSLPHIKAGKLKALLVLSPDRISQMCRAL